MSINNYLRKKLGIKANERINKGPCCFCNKDVYVAEGQLYKTLNKKPTHKKCRP